MFMKTNKLRPKIIFKLSLIILSLVVLISSCIKTFDYSVYSSYVPVSYRDSREDNQLELTNIENSIQDGEPFKFVFISDSHTSYNDLDDFACAIKDIPEVLFILHGGDLTDGGMLAEYQIYYDIMEKAQKPYFQVIGNHDCLANGLSIYNDMYGKDDYVLTFKNCKFIFFNDIVWELENREPDYFWLMEQLEDTVGYDHVFVISHISPLSDSFTPLNSYAYLNILKKYNVDLSVHGHDHDYLTGTFEGDIDYLIIGSIDKKHYIEVTVENESFYLNRKPF